MAVWNHPSYKKMQSDLAKTDSLGLDLGGDVAHYLRYIEPNHRNANRSSTRERTLDERYGGYLKRRADWEWQGRG